MALDIEPGHRKAKHGSPLSHRGSLDLGVALACPEDRTHDAAVDDARVDTA